MKTHNEFNKFITNHNQLYYKLIYSCCELAEVSSDIIVKTYTTDELNIPFIDGDFIMHKVFMYIIDNNNKRNTMTAFLNNNSSIDINQKNTLGKTILYNMINDNILYSYEKRNLFKLLVSLGINISSIDNDGNTIMHAIVKNCKCRHIWHYIKSYEGLSLLLNTPNNDGLTPMQMVYERYDEYFTSNWFSNMFLLFTPARLINYLTSKGGVR